MEELHLRREGGTAHLLLNRPERRNAVSLAMWRELRGLLPALGADDTVQLVVIRGAGGHFSAGADISEFPRVRWDADQARRYGAVFDGALDAIAACPKPTVAVIEGFCVGGGLDIACACDLRIASEDARFGAPVARIGVPLGWGELRRLVALIGPGAARELLLTGRLIDAAEALNLGLAHRVLPAEEVEAGVAALIRSIRAGSNLVHRTHKHMLSQTGPDVASPDPFAVFDSHDFHEGVAAFLTKRPPSFRGC